MIWVFAAFILSTSLFLYWLLPDETGDGPHVENRSIGELADLDKHISSLLSGTTPWSVLTVEMINTDDAIQFSPDYNTVRIDCPLRPGSKYPLETVEARIYESVGLKPGHFDAGEGREFINAYVTGEPAKIARIGVELASKLFGQSGTAPTRFVLEGTEEEANGAVYA